MNIEIGKGLVFYEEDSTYSGVKKAAENVKEDIRLVTGCKPETFFEGTEAKNGIIYGTVGHSAILAELEKEGKIELSMVRGKWEVYSFTLVEAPLPGMEKALVIAGSDKRGTIYGLYRLSELIGVSPFVNWNHLWPAQKEKLEFDEKINQVSKEPSVKYRGFFINDEWPAFGTWAKTHFGGINAECYERVFELLLRLKGNYLWPAMWDSDFSLDGPGLLSAELADEYGVVMSTSHHEPCMRSGAEFGKFSGDGSPYGSAWNFNANPEGITRFWRDGLLRNRAYENVITMGMRGENDTAILGKEATLKDNIDLLRKVLKTQNRLIRETICEDLEKVPRQIVLFTEVEEFFYGNADVPGLMGDPELEGVTLMLSDNNHGSTRTLPSEKMRGHKGGYGMYYHMDMHGGAHSYQWIGSTYLPKLWEQMTMAYEYGVREIWVTNIGDIGTQEFGLSYFLSLAYDIKKWGGTDAAVTTKYTEEWLRTQFGQCFNEEELEQLKQVFLDYTGLLARRRHEVMNEKVYHPVHFGEAEDVLQRSQKILEICDKLKAKCPKRLFAAFISLVYYPACGTANLMKLWILTGRNHLYAKQNRIEANDFAERMSQCFDVDYELTKEYHTVDEGYFYGFGLSEHIGFTNWNEDDNKYPVRMYVHPANQPRMILARVEDERYCTGLPWTNSKQTWKDALRPDIDEIVFDIACGSREPLHYRIETDCPWISFSSTEGIAEKTERVRLLIHRERFEGKVKGRFTVVNEGYGKAEIELEAENPKNIPQEAFLERNGYIAIEAKHFQKKKDTDKGRFLVLEPYGRTGSAIKAFPVTMDFLDEQERPYVEYHFAAEKAGRYRIRFYMAATTPVVYERKQYIGFSVNETGIQIVNTVEKEEVQFFTSEQWTKEAYNNIKILETDAECKEGLNTLRFFGMSPAIVLERIVLYPEGTKLPESYLGPRESYYCKGNA